MPKSINKEDLKDIRKNEISNLKFLDKFIKMRKLTKPQFAELIGMTKANVYHWFKEYAGEAVPHVEDAK